MGLLRYIKFAPKRSKNKLVHKNAVTRVHGSCSLQVMGSCPRGFCWAPPVHSFKFLVVALLFCPLSSNFKPLLCWVFLFFAFSFKLSVKLLLLSSNWSAILFPGSRFASLSINTFLAHDVVMPWAFGGTPMALNYSLSHSILINLFIKVKLNTLLLPPLLVVLLLFQVPFTHMFGIF